MHEELRRERAYGRLSVMGVCVFAVVFAACAEDTVDKSTDGGAASDGGVEEQCTTAAQCPHGQVCDEGACKTDCRLPGVACAGTCGADGVCRLGGDDDTTCTRTCTPPEVLNETTCTCAEPPECDIVDQDCPDGQKCDFTEDLSTECTDDGSRQVGDSCGGEQGGCVRGGICVQSGEGGSVCRRVCDPNLASSASGCEGGELCTHLTGVTDAGACVGIQSCDIFTQEGCGAGLKCTLLTSDGVVGCARAGAVTIDQPCGTGGTDDCAAGLLCVATEEGGASTCGTICMANGEDEAAKCTGEEQCGPLEDVSGIGVCVASGG